MEIGITQFWSSDPIIRNLVKDTHGFLRSKKPVDFTAAVGSVADNASEINEGFKI